jgi:hypothetical protein
MDVIDQMQDAAERLEANRPTVRAGGGRRRNCIRCGNILPAEALRENPDALDCSGTCDAMRGP